MKKGLKTTAVLNFVIMILLLSTPSFAVGDPLHPQNSLDGFMSGLMCVGMFGWACGALYYACRQN